MDPPNFANCWQNDSPSAVGVSLPLGMADVFAKANALRTKEATCDVGVALPLALRSRWRSLSFGDITPTQVKLVTNQWQE